MKTTAITQKKTQKNCRECLVIYLRQTVVKIVPPTVVIMQIEWREIKPASDSPKRKPRKKVKGRGQAKLQSELRVVCTTTCNTAYAWQWNVIHLWLAASMDLNAFLNISNAYLMPHATPEQAKNETKMKTKTTTGNANVQRGVCAMSADAIKLSGYFGVFWCLYHCLRLTWHVCQLAISLLAPLSVPAGTNFSLQPAVATSTSPSRLVLQIFCSFLSSLLLLLLALATPLLSLLPLLVFHRFYYHKGDKAIRKKQ